jgi:hypothetical protein
MSDLSENLPTDNDHGLIRGTVFGYYFTRKYVGTSAVPKGTKKCMLYFFLFFSLRIQSCPAATDLSRTTVQHYSFKCQVKTCGLVIR